MATTTAGLFTAAEINSQAAIDARASFGRIPWAGPAVLLVARPVLMIVAQALAALIFLGLNDASPWRTAGYWWKVYGTFVDIGCLSAMWYFTRREGIRMRDLLGQVRMKHGPDIFLGLGYFVLVMPLFVFGGMVAHWLVFGATPDYAAQYLLSPHRLPLWSSLYSLLVWVVIWSPTEEATYQAYTLPRVKALTGRTWAAFVLVGFVWAFQHSLLPVIPGFRYMAFRTLAFLPGVLALMGIYWRTRRLAPLVIAHWPMDLVAIFMTTTY